MKRLIRIVTVVLIMVFAIATTASAMSVQASSFISSVVATTTASGGGKVTGTGKIGASQTCSKIGVTSIYLQENRSGSWVTVASATGKYGTSTADYSYSVSYSGTAGKTYRTVASFTATCNGVTETRSSITSSTKTAT